MQAEKLPLIVAEASLAVHARMLGGYEACLAH
jgi:hypothetical protein